MSIEINGTEYMERVDFTHNKRMSRAMAMFAVIGAAYGVGRCERPAPDVNIAQEFALIQQKKSNLSRREREAVVRKFNSMYTPSPNKQ